MSSNIKIGRLKMILFTVLPVLIILFSLETGFRLYGFFNPYFNEFENAAREQGVTTDNKNPGEVRIFVLGESAVEGLPYTRDMSFPNLMNKLMKDSGNNEVRVVNLGVKGKHSFYHREIAGLFSRYKADHVVIYAGNNDTRDFSNVIGDEWAAWLDFKLTWSSTFYADMKRKIIKIQKWVNKRAHSQVFAINYNFDDVWHWTDSYISKKKRYMENPVEGLRRKSRAIKDYESNLDALVNFLKRKKIKVHIADLGINYKNEPGISDLKKGLGPKGKGYMIYYQDVFTSDEEAKKWQGFFTDGKNKLAAKEYDEALAFFDQAAAINSLNPLLAFYQGESLEKIGRFAEAKAKYLLAKELEIQSPGGSPAKNAALKRIAKKYSTAWIPIQETLEMVSPNGIVGNELFLDHCHYNLYGHKIVAATIMQSLCNAGTVKCPINSKWESWFEKLSSGGLDKTNLANEHVMNAFYLMNGTPSSPEPNYHLAVFYLEEAMKLDSRNIKIHPLLIESYWHLGEIKRAEKVLQTVREMDESAYLKVIKKFPNLKS